eukprot:540662-Amphidinium_carterae.1
MHTSGAGAPFEPSLMLPMTCSSSLHPASHTATPWLTRFMVALEVYCTYQPPSPPAAATAETNNSEQNLPPA